MRSGHCPSAPEGLWSDPDRVLTHFDDMGADVVATHSARCCNPMMAVENVVLTVPSPHLDRRERLLGAWRPVRCPGGRGLPH